MKTSLPIFRAAELFSLGALVLLAGCTSVPMRQSTQAFEMENTPAALEMNHPGYTAPIVLHTVDPEHPWELKRLGVTGTVKVQMMVDETGRVSDAEVTSSSNTAFNGPTLAALKQWEFKPASLHGVANPARVSIPVLYQLK